MTRSIANVAADSAFRQEINVCLQRDKNTDWGCICDEDKETNNRALSDDDRILAAYETSRGKTWIITEYDRSITIILFPSEY